jgi:hypothetical protein
MMFPKWPSPIARAFVAAMIPVFAAEELWRKRAHGLAALKEARREARRLLLMCWNGDVG